MRHGSSKQVGLGGAALAAEQPACLDPAAHQRPKQTGEPAGQHVAQVMSPQVQATYADQADQQEAQLTM